MRIIHYIWTLFVITATCGCSRDIASEPHSDHVSIYLSHDGFNTRVIDEDNPASEQIINNISVFLTPAFSDEISHAFVNPGFSINGEYKVVTLPLQPADLNIRDIYVVTNYDNLARLNSVTTVSELRDLTTPMVDKTNNLEATKGFCMYGFYIGHDFTNAVSPPIVRVERTCAKYLVNLTFPQDPELSTDNSFLIAGAANYTYLGRDTGLTIPSGAYFNFAAPLPLNQNTAGQYVNTAYVYEASQAPELYLYVNISGTPQEFSTTLPVPDRNYFYELDVRIYEDITRPEVRSLSNHGIYRCEISVVSRLAGF